MKQLLALLLVLLPGCFLRAQGGYQTMLPGVDPGGGQLEISAGLGDLRKAPRPAEPSQYNADVVAHIGLSGHRFGFGLSTLWAPLAGWDHDWSPTIRLGGRALQLEWFPLASGSVSGFVELGVAFFPDRGTRKRKVYSISLGAELFGRYGIATDPVGRFTLLFGITWDSSIGPTS